MSAAVQAAASLVVVLALVCAAAALARTRDVGTALQVLLELLLAAGLLRLALDSTWRQIVVAAVIVVLRRVLSSALSSSTRTPHRAAPRPDGGGESVPHR